MKLQKTLKETNLNKKEEVEALLDSFKEAYLELRHEISELRKQQRNPIIPDGLSRNIPSKIKYAEVSKSEEDLQKAENIILEVEKEIEYCKTEELVDVKKEISEKYKDKTMTKEEREAEKAEI